MASSIAGEFVKLTAGKGKNGSSTNNESFLSRTLYEYQRIVRHLLSLKTFPCVADREFKDFKKRSAITAYSCRQPHCNHHFETEQLRREHEKMHDQQFQCIFADCPYKLPFRSSRALRKHVLEHHTKSTPTIVRKSVRQNKTGPRRERHASAAGLVLKDSTSSPIPISMPSTDMPQDEPQDQLPQQQEGQKEKRRYFPVHAPPPSPNYPPSSHTRNPLSLSSPDASSPVSPPSPSWSPPSPASRPRYPSPGPPPPSPPYLPPPDPPRLRPQSPTWSPPSPAFRPSSPKGSIFQGPQNKTNHRQNEPVMCSPLDGIFMWG